MTANIEAKQLGILELLKLRGFDVHQPAKLVRHQDPRCDVNDFVRRGWFEFYQATQAKPRFRHCKRIVSFVGAGGTKARFICGARGFGADGVNTPLMAVATISYSNALLRQTRRTQRRSHIRFFRYFPKRLHVKRSHNPRSATRRSSVAAQRA